MRKITMSLVLCLLLGLCTLPAGAVKMEDTMLNSHAVLYNPEGETADIYAEKDASSALMGSFFNGTELYMFQWGPEWTYAAVNADWKVVGYIETKYVAFGDAMEQVQSSTPLVEIAPADGGAHTLTYMQAEQPAVITGKLDAGLQVRLLSAAGEWRLVETETDAGVLAGFVQSADLKETGEAAEVSRFYYINALMNKPRLMDKNGEEYFVDPGEIE